MHEEPEARPRNEERGPRADASEHGDPSLGQARPIERAWGNADRYFFGAMPIATDLTITLSPVTSPMTLAIFPASLPDRKSTRLNSSHIQKSRMPSSA